MAKNGQNYLCTLCFEEEVSKRKQSKAYFHTAKLLIEHYQKEHPDAAATLFDAVGETWDHQLTNLLKEASDLRLALRKANNQVSELIRSNQNLAAKLNGVILLLRD